jgi:nucleoside-diphosphate-sugar epimerase
MSTLKHNSALITGAPGYIGRFLTLSLIELGWNVHIILRPESLKSIFDLKFDKKLSYWTYDGTFDCMNRILKKSKPQIVFHLASKFTAEHSHSDIDLLISSNIQFATHLAEAMRQNEVSSLINTSTSWQHYNSDSYNPANLYAATKQAFENILTYYVNATGLKVITLVLFDSYGPNDSRGKLISLLWKAAISKQTIPMSPGEQKIDLVYISDIVDAYILAANNIVNQKSGHLRYGVTSGQRIRVIDLVKLFQQVTNMELDIKFGARPYRLREVFLPWDDFTVLPSWHPKVKLEDGILLARPSEFEI